MRRAGGIREVVRQDRITGAKMRKCIGTTDKAKAETTPEMGAILDATPRDRLLILTNASGSPLTTHRASEGLRQWRDKAGLTPEALGYDLRLQDTRGTAATRLLNAGLSLAEIAAHMRWSVRHAASIIEHYARVSPDESV